MSTPGGARPEPVAPRLGPTAVRADAFRTAAVAAAAAHPPVPDPIGDPPNTVSNLNVANLLTLLRLLLVPVFAVVLFRHHGSNANWRVLAWAVFAAASITDRIDGELARRRHLVTELGKLADPIADKALIGTALVGLSVLGELTWWVTVVILIRELGVTGLRFWVIRHGVIPASRGGKIKTMLQGVAIGLYVLPFSGWWHTAAQVVMAAAVVLTVLTGIDYVARATSVRRRGRAPVGGRRPVTEENAVDLGQLQARLIEDGSTVAVAESLTGGLLSAALTELPGSSGFLRGGLVVYATDLKARLAGVPTHLLAERGAVDADVALFLARGARDRLSATYGLSLTGVAGPDPQDGKVVGTVFIGLAGPTGESVAQRHFNGDRSAIRAQAVLAAVELLERESRGRPAAL